MPSRKLQSIIDRARQTLATYHNLPLHTKELEDFFLGKFIALKADLVKQYGVGSRRAIITQDTDTRSLHMLPSILTVYRGFREPQKRVGISWTLDRRIAERFAYKAMVSVDPNDLLIATIDGRDFFARGYPDGAERNLVGVVLKGTCSLSNVLAYTNRINEQEIIVSPDAVTVLGEDRNIREEMKEEVDAGLVPMALAIEQLLK